MLEMGHARHRNFEVGFGLSQESADEYDHTRSSFSHGITDKKAKVGGNEFVPAAPGVQFPAQRAEKFNQGLFHEVMDVFGGRGVEPGEIGLGAFRDFVQSTEGLANFHFVENAGTQQSPGPGAIDGKFIGEKAAVERKRALKRVELFIRRAIEAA